MAVITNLMPNPSFEVNITDSWSDFNSTGSAQRFRSTAHYVFGAASLNIYSDSGLIDSGKLSAQLVLPAGTYYASAYVKTGADITNACTVLRTTGFVNLLTSNITSANQDWQRVSDTFTLGASTTVEWVVGLGAYGATSQGEAWWDGFMITETASLVDYFDGSTTDTSQYTYDWTGTANNSSSTRTDVESSRYRKRRGKGF